MTIKQEFNKERGQAMGESYPYSVQLKGVSKSYTDHCVLDNIDMELEKGKFYTLLGPSGCGKTTILRLIAGFSSATTGEVFLKGQLVNEVPAEKRQVNTVFQDYALFPHMNVYDNIAFGLRVKGVEEATIKEKVKNALALIQLSGYELRDIQALSGGQRQRIAIARAIVNEPDVLLLDEPLSALDLKLRTAMQYELRELQRRLGITFIFVTHDQEEALAMSDWIFVMDNGKIVQSGPPKDIYDEPINRYVAEFIGESNILPATMLEDYKVRFLGKVFVCEDAGMNPNESVEVVIRPEDLAISSEKKGQIEARVDTVLFRGVFNEIIATDQTGYQWRVHTTKSFEHGQIIYLEIEPYDIHVMRFGESEKDFDARLEQYSEGDDDD